VFDFILVITKESAPATAHISLSRDGSHSVIV